MTTTDTHTAFGLDGWRWFGEPKNWSVSDGLTVTTDPDTDFWQVTHYGFTPDSGHLLARELRGDFIVTASFSGEYEAQYDQAGLMLRIDRHNWIKTGIEYVDGVRLLSAVVTRDFSDWSTSPAGGAAVDGPVSLKVERRGDAVTVWAGVDGDVPGTMIRLAYFPPAVPVLAGVMCASPKGQGFTVRFPSVEFGA